MPFAGKKAAFPRNQNELNVLKHSIKETWQRNTSDYLSSIIESNEVLIKQIELRNQVMQEIINERKQSQPDVIEFKSRQFAD